MSKFTATIILEVQDEDSIEVIDYVTHPSLPEYGDMIEEMDVSHILEINPETETIVPMEEGVYNFLVTVESEDETYTVEESVKLTDEEASKYYGELNIPEFKILD